LPTIASKGKTTGTRVSVFVPEFCRDHSEAVFPNPSYGAYIASFEEVDKFLVIAVTFTLTIHRRGVILLPEFYSVKKS
jgi:hypothetical protein